MARKTETRRDIPTLHVFPLDENAVDFIMKSDEIKDYIYEHTYKGIEDAFKNNKKTAPLFKLNTSDSYIELSDSEWIKAINSCISYYEKKEKFETCFNLTNLRTNINKSKTPKVII
jgi:hypothetical protein